MGLPPQTTINGPAFEAGGAIIIHSPRCDSASRCFGAAAYRTFRSMHETRSRRRQCWAGA
eukprot:2963555-Pleurochrysis_carterae.AAC.1